jgi:hypothetical protein
LIYPKSKSLKVRVLLAIALLVGSLSLSLGKSVNAFASGSAYQASGVIGQPDFTSHGYSTGPNQFDYPSSTVLDSVHHRLFVADLYNYRVVVYQLDNNNQYQNNDASYVIGAADLNSVGYDANTQNGLYEGPVSIAYDPVNNRLFVMDYYRVLVFNLSGGITDGMNASYVLGQPDFTSENDNQTRSSLDEPGEYGSGLAFDPTNDRLFVSDYERVMVYNVAPTTIANGEDASNVIGEPDFTSSNNTCSRSGLGLSYYDDAAMSLAFDDANQRLFVNNGYSCSNILVYNVAPNIISNGEDASNVLGEPDFTTDASHQDTANGLDYASGLAYNPNGDTLYVGDYYGGRILLFDVSPTTIANNEDAYGVLGQPDFATYNSGASQSLLDYNYYGAGGFAVDPATGTLFWPDQGNNRILIYNFIKMTTPPGQLSSGTVGQNYSQSLTSTQSQGFVTYSITSGSLPPGLVLNPSTGIISGKPTRDGSYTFEITAYDDNGTAGHFKDDPSYTITIAGGAVSAPDTGLGSPDQAGPWIDALALLGLLAAAGGLWSYRRHY